MTGIPRTVKQIEHGLHHSAYGSFELDHTPHFSRAIWRAENYRPPESHEHIEEEKISINK